MIFNHIKLENFRQYKGTHQVSFSNPQKDGSITLIIADNGAGKTTFLQAFRYCFYGNLQNNKYVNLPNPNDLISNSIIDEIDDGDKETVSVEIQFSHNSKKYVMRRETDYKKISNKMESINTKSSLSYSTEYDGYFTLNDEQADLEMLQILPSGLSHIFMFDGERMERRIDSNEFRTDLKDSVLGILNIKTYDTLIQQLGSVTKKSTLLGRLQDRISHSSIEQITEANRLKMIQEKNESDELEISNLKEELKNQRSRLRDAKNNQERIINNKELLEQRDRLEIEERACLDKVSNTSRDMMHIGFQALYKKELIKVRKLYEEFIQSQKDDKNFYQFLHIETLKEILHRGQCICGSKIMSDSSHEDHIRKLFDSALPNSSAQNLSFISSDIFYNSSDLNEDKKKMLSFNSHLNELAEEQRAIESKITKLNIEIKDNEAILGETSQINIEARQERIEQINKHLGFLERQLVDGKNAEKKQLNKVKPMLEQDDNNKKVNYAISSIQRMLENITEEKTNLEEKARLILSKHFNENLSLVMSGSYRTSIKADYYIEVIDQDKDKVSTSVLSTGQSVVVSISFIRALIDTASELSKEYSKGESYAVIMDAALSNLDEKHIRNVSKYNLNNFDQLIFISFKRQLRNEMYDSIKDNVGIVYEFIKEPDEVIINRIPENEIEQFIHKTVNEND